MPDGPAERAATLSTPEGAKLAHWALFAYPSFGQDLCRMVAEYYLGGEHPRATEICGFALADMAQESARKAYDEDILMGEYIIEAFRASTMARQQYLHGLQLAARRFERALARNIRSAELLTDGTTDRERDRGRPIQ